MSGHSFNPAAGPGESGQQVEYLVSLKTLGFGLNDCEREQSACFPVVLHERAYAKLYGLGIHGDGVNGRDAFDALAVDEVVFQNGGRFNFLRDCGIAGHRVAIIIPVRDEFGELIDLAAWRVETDELALWRGRASMLGAENVFATRLGEPIKVYETVAGWLRSGREGVFVIDGQRAAPLLRSAEPLGVRTEAFGRRLRESLTIRAPHIVVASKARSAA